MIESNAVTSLNARSAGLAWALASVALVAAAQLLLKLGGGLAPLAALLEAHIDWVSLAQIGIGLCCYGVSMLCWLRALESMSIGRAYPLLSLSYPLVYFGALALPVLHETPSAIRLAGVILVMIGILLLVPHEAVEKNTRSD